MPADDIGPMSISAELSAGRYRSFFLQTEASDVDPF